MAQSYPHKLSETNPTPYKIRVGSHEFDLERWKHVPLEPGVEVSDFGRVRRMGELLKATISVRSHTQTNPKPYKAVTIWLNTGDGRKQFLVSRLVATHFIPFNLDPKNTVNHINLDSTCNLVDNLEWCSLRDNIKHYYDSR